METAKRRQQRRSGALPEIDGSALLFPLAAVVPAPLIIVGGFVVRYAF